MKYQVKAILASFLAIALLTPLSGQNPTPDDDVIRITTNLVQVDATVTDKNGRIIRDLAREDFEVFEDGKLQEITNFNFVDVPEGQIAGSGSSGNPKGKGATAPPPTGLTAAQVSNTIAIVIDDLCMSQQALVATREALREFAAKQLPSNALVAFFRTRASGSIDLGGAFTSDPRQINRAISQVRWYPSLGCNDDGPFRSDFKLTGNGGFSDANTKASTQRVEDMTRLQVNQGKFGTLRYVIAGLERLPGRKSILLISEGFGASGRNTLDVLDNASNNREGMKRVVEQANRASIVINTLNANGLFNPDFISAQDDVIVSARTGQDDATLLRESRADLARRQEDSLIYMASETGGLAVRNQNLFGPVIQQALESNKSYYLLGYKPSAESLKKNNTLRNITVRVKRPGLTVRHRRGYVGLKPVKANRPVTEYTALVDALATPLETNGVRLRLACFFGYDAQKGYFVRAVIHINPNDITFAGDPKSLSLDVAAVTSGDPGQKPETFYRQHKLRAADARQNPAEAMRYGLTYTTDIAVKKPGGYQFRVAVRDNHTQAIGSANQYVEIPDLKKNHLALSGLVMSEARANETPAMPPSAPLEAALQVAAAPSDLSARVFRPGMIAAYGYVIYNARLKDGKPNLRAQLRIYQEGRVVMEAPEESYDPTGQTDPARLREERLLRLGANLTPGDYVLHATVKDLNDNGYTVSQWIDFEIVK
jgi:VWFA-related protein